jgi:hypothetical protein
MFIVALALMMTVVVVVVMIGNIVLMLSWGGGGGLHYPTALRKISEHTLRARTIVIGALTSALTMQS